MSMSPPVNTSLVVHWIQLNCHSFAIKPINAAVSKQAPPSGYLRNERILQVQKAKKAREDVQLLMQVCEFLSAILEWLLIF